jgi:ribulose-bisphosphate carboxylase large chain
MLGSMLMNSTQGIDHGVLLGTLIRLAGADISIFPNIGGRFSFTQEQCLSIAEKSRAELGDMKKMWIAPSGGMSLERIPDMISMYGNDVALLIGGALYRGDIYTNAKAMVDLVN